MKIPPLVWMLGAVAVLTAFAVQSSAAGTGAPPAIAEVARLAGCPDGPVRHGTGIRERIACTEDGFKVDVVTFDDNTQRDAWVEGLRTVVITSGLAGIPDVLVAGDRWAVHTDDAERARCLAAVARGWKV